MSFRRLLPALSFAALVVAWVVAVLLIFMMVQETTRRQVERIDASQRLLTTMLDQESSIRSFLSTADNDLLDPYREARGRFDDLVEDELEATEDPGMDASLLTQQQSALRWRRLAADDLRLFQVSAARLRANLREREAELDRFRSENQRYRAELITDLQQRNQTLLLRTAGLVLALSLLAGALVLVVMRRRVARDRRYASAQREFAVAMQSAMDVGEADALLARHLERQLGARRVTVLRRGDDGDRLEAGTPLEPDAPLAAGLLDATGRDCLAIRRSGPHVQGEDDPLVACAVCGASGPTTCQPLLVGDRIIGSVLVEQGADADGSGRRRAKPPAGPAADVLSDSLAQAAPVLSGLRTLALAQSRATTDALTGLPNRWALQDALRRMLAHSARTGRPLALVLLDLDHFKRLNDTHGHDAGDQALAAVGHALLGGLRESDLAARSGGEEFAVLLPDTSLEGALAVAEQLRQAVAAIELPLPGGYALSASFGVAVLPLHAVEAEGLMRVADRAMYAAKRAGRDRVEVAEAPHLGIADPFAELP